jgi:hypothetical protein
VAVSDISVTSAAAIFFTGTLHFFLVTSSPCQPHIDARVSLTLILVKKMPAAFRQPASFTIGANAASIYAAL